jgi:hypothetical protein
MSEPKFKDGDLVKINNVSGKPLALHSKIFVIIGSYDCLVARRAVLLSEYTRRKETSIMKYYFHDTEIDPFRGINIDEPIVCIDTNTLQSDICGSKNPIRKLGAYIIKNVTPLGLFEIGYCNGICIGPCIGSCRTKTENFRNFWYAPERFVSKKAYDAYMQSAALATGINFTDSLKQPETIMENNMAKITTASTLDTKKLMDVLETSLQDTIEIIQENTTDSVDSIIENAESGWAHREVEVLLELISSLGFHVEVETKITIVAN